MLDQATHAFLADILTTRPRRHLTPQVRPFAPGFSPAHLKCYFTAMQAAVEFDEPPQPGILFLHLNGKLFPWSHMVNRQGANLVDYSPTVDQEQMGFIETDWSEFSEWRKIMGAYNDRGAYAGAAAWNDPLADDLTKRFFQTFPRPWLTRFGWA